MVEDKKDVEVKTPKANKEPSAAYNAAEVLFNNKEAMITKYRNLIRHTGGMVSASMTYAYSKALNDAINLLILQENKDNVEVSKKDA